MCFVFQLPIETSAIVEISKTIGFIISHLFRGWEQNERKEQDFMKAEGNTWLLLTRLEQDRRSTLESQLDGSMVIGDDLDETIYRTPGELSSQLMQRVELRQNQVRVLSFSILRNCADCHEMAGRDC